MRGEACNANIQRHLGQIDKSTQRQYFIVIPTLQDMKTHWMLGCPVQELSRLLEAQQLPAKHRHNTHLKNNWSVFFQTQLSWLPATKADHHSISRRESAERRIVTSNGKTIMNSLFPPQKIKCCNYAVKPQQIWQTSILTSLLVGGVSIISSVWSGPSELSLRCRILMLVLVTVPLPASGQTMSVLFKPSNVTPPVVFCVDPASINYNLTLIYRRKSQLEQ